MGKGGVPQKKKKGKRKGRWPIITMQFTHLSTEPMDSLAVTCLACDVGEEGKISEKKEKEKGSSS